MFFFFFFFFFPGQGVFLPLPLFPRTNVGLGIAAMTRCPQVVQRIDSMFQGVSFVFLPQRQGLAPQLSSLPATEPRTPETRADRNQELVELQGPTSHRVVLVGQSICACVSTGLVPEGDGLQQCSKYGCC